MKFLILIILLSTTSCAHSANTSIHTKDNNIKRSTATSTLPSVKFIVLNEVPNFTLAYVYEKSEVSISITGGFKSKELPGSGNALFVSLVNNENPKEPVTNWYPTGLTHSEKDENNDAFSIKIGREDSLVALKSLSQLSLVFSEDQKELIGTLSLSSYCETNPDNFKDTTTTKVGCFPDQEKLKSIPAKTGEICTNEQISKEDSDFSCGLPDILKENVEEKLGCKLQCNN